MDWPTKVRAILATAVIICVPLLALDMVAAHDSPILSLVNAHVGVAVVALGFSFLLSAKLADFLMDAEWMTRAPASIVSMAALAAQVGALVVVLNAMQAQR
jgi:hypothetical protein